MNLLITIAFTPTAGDEEIAGRVGIQFEGDLDMPLASVFKGLNRFLTELDCKLKEAEKAGLDPKSLGDLFPAG